MGNFTLCLTRATIGALAFALIGCGQAEEVVVENIINRPASDGGACSTITDCRPGSFACSNGRCQLGQPSTCPETGLGHACTFISGIDGVEYSGRCTFHGGQGGYFCAPDCTSTPCLHPDSSCQPARPTGQPGDWKVCMDRCTESRQCLGGTWECNSQGQCVVPNESACVGKLTLQDCSFQGPDGTDYEGICSAPPPTVDGPPYYSDTNLCVRLCDMDDPSTCDRIKGVCQRAEPEGGGSAPDGSDYGVCVAPVCDGDEDCPGSMFGCEDEICLWPSYTACDGKGQGAACERILRGAPVPGVCHAGVCFPTCEADGEMGPGSCPTNPASTRCLEFTFDGGVTQGLCMVSAFP